GGETVGVSVAGTDVDSFAVPGDLAGADAADRCRPAAAAVDAEAVQAAAGHGQQDFFVVDGDAGQAAHHRCAEVPRPARPTGLGVEAVEVVVGRRYGDEAVVGHESGSLVHRAERAFPDRLGRIGADPQRGDLTQNAGSDDEVAGDREV